MRRAEEPRPEASSARYGLGTLAMLGSFMLWKIGLSRSKLFRAAPKPAPAATTTDS